MKTTLDLPDNLIKEAQNITHSKTKAEVIIKALENLINQDKIKKIKNYKGKVKLDIDLNALRNR